MTGSGFLVSVIVVVSVIINDAVFGFIITNVVVGFVLVVVNGVVVTDVVIDVVVSDVLSASLYERERKKNKADCLSRMQSGRSN